MINKITEKFLQELGFDYDERNSEYKLHCAKYLYINVQFFSTDEYYVGLELHDTTASLYHISEKQQLVDLVKALSGEDI